MDMPREQPQPTFGERAARNAVFVFLILAMITLAFGLAWGIQDIRQDDDGPGASTQNISSGDGDTVGAAVIDEIVELLKNQYVDKSLLDDETLRLAAINGIITALNDTHTEYLTPEELKAGALQLDSSYDGIGASVSDSTGAVTIVTPFRDSPAEKAGIRQGDTVLTVDGESTEGWTSEQAVERIRGQQGTTVTLGIKHTDGTTETLTITRGNIPIESVYIEPNLEVIPGESGKDLVDRTGAVVTSEIAYVNISQFHDRTLQELRTKMNGVENKGYKGLILDLRGNPGGLLQATVDVADEFLTSGTIISEVDANGQTRSWSAKSGGLATKIPIVVLVDNGSASGAEVLAAAIKDNGRGQVVGVRTFGKGTVNQLQPLKNCGEKECGALYLSVGRWLTPNGDQIEGLGVKPDLELPMTYDEYIDNGDLQVFKAIDILLGR